MSEFIKKTFTITKVLLFSKKCLYHVFFQTFYFIHLFSVFRDVVNSGNLFLSVDSAAC